MNKKFLLCLLAAIITCTNLVARQLDPDQALSIALSKLSKSTNIQYAKTRSSVSLKLTHTELNPNSVPLYYVYDMPQGGFLIAGADSRSHGLLGYTDNGSFSDAQNNPSFLCWLKECQNALSWLSNQPETPSHSIQSTTRTSDESTLASSIAPLLGANRWNQKDPYNLFCPTMEDTEGYTQNCLTGCVATAMAQVMKYYNWPDCGEGSHTNANLESQSVDFSQSVYDWDNMLDNYTGVEYTEVQANAVAKLMADVGCSVNMNYGINSSGAWGVGVVNALTTYFKYDKGIEFHARYQYNSEEWNTLLKKELNELRPIYMMAGTNYNFRHAFVIDGYDSNGLFHVNWGMDRTGNGYFSLDYMISDSMELGGAVGGFICEQEIITNIKPDKTRTSVAHSDLRLYTNIYYQNKEFCYDVVNYGLADFTGSVGIALKNEKDEIIHESWDSLSKTPLKYFPDYYSYKYSIPDSITIKSGYSVTPVYKQAEDQEIHTLKGRATGANKLIAKVIDKKISWLADQEADLEYLDCKVYPLHKGETPKVTVSVNNISDIEYNECIYAIITKGNLGYGQGMSQLYLQPGDSTTVTINCNLYYGNTSYRDLEIGEYDLILAFESGGQMYYLTGETFVLKVDAPKASDITYSDFAINDSVFVQGDKLVATFKATNNGDFEYNNYSFYIFDDSDMSLATFTAYSVFIPEKDSVIVTIEGTINLEPGNYEGYLSSSTDWLTYDSFNFRVKDTSTAIEAIDNTESNNDNTLTLDLYGRKVDQIKPGHIYIRRGKKIIEKTN